jgi:hypothetical protein
LVSELCEPVELQNVRFAKDVSFAPRSDLDALALKQSLAFVGLAIAGAD